MWRCYGTWGDGWSGPGSNGACRRCRGARIAAPTSIWGNDGTSPSSCSQCEISRVAMAYAPMKLVPGLRQSTSHARPNQVAADSLPKPNEERSAREAVIPSVRASRKCGMKPPEKHAEIRSDEHTSELQ